MTLMCDVTEEGLAQNESVILYFYYEMAQSATLSFKVHKTGSAYKIKPSSQDEQQGIQYLRNLKLLEVFFHNLEIQKIINLIFFLCVSCVFLGKTEAK